MHSLVGAPATHLPIPATLSRSFSNGSTSLLNNIILVQGASKVLFVGQVVVWGRPALLLSSINISLREVVIIMVMRGVDQTMPFVHV